MLEPYEEDERRQAEWDAKCAAAPRCCHCNDSVYPHDTYVETSNGLVFCEECFKVFFTEDLEL